MVRTLTERREAVLRIIVNEYIDKAIPVASEVICRSYNLGVSPATIRNDMSYLEEAGFLYRPHISAGAVPSVKAYRYYVESLIADARPTTQEQVRIRGLFKEVEREFEDWARMAASLLSRLFSTMAVVTPPKTARCYFRHLELVAVQDYQVLLIVVLDQATVKKQMLTVMEIFTQDDLNVLANSLNLVYHGLVASDVLAKDQPLTALGKQVRAVVADLMSKEDELDYEEPLFEGLRLMVNQPEFLSGEQVRNAMELVEKKDWLSILSRQKLAKGEVRVVIGDESQEQLLTDLSVIFTGYGVPKASGAIGVIGPTRMDYARAISTVRYLSEILSKLVGKEYAN